jgi:hypothetical protein
MQDEVAPYSQGVHPVVIKQVLDHLGRRAGQQPLALKPLARAPPQDELPGLEE